MQETTAILLFTVLFTIVIFVAIVVPFLLTLRNTLRLVKPENQSILPNQVWIVLIPVVGLFWAFIVVTRLAYSLDDEFQSRGMAQDSASGRSVGIAFLICNLLANILNYISAVLGGLVFLAAIVLFIIYWVKIADYKKLLKQNDSLGSLHV
jgi:hypothetical protein